MPQRRVDIAVVRRGVAVDGSWRPLQRPLARVSGGMDIDEEGGANTTLDRGGEGIGARRHWIGGAMRAYQKWFWRNSIFSCDRR